MGTPWEKINKITPPPPPPPPPQTPHHKKKQPHKQHNISPTSQSTNTTKQKNYHKI